MNIIADENSEAVGRESELVLTYGEDATDTLKLIQAAISFTINVTDSTTTSFAYEVVPKDTSMTYWSQVVEKEYFDQFESAKEFINSDVELIKHYAAEQGVGYEEFLKTSLKRVHIAGN